MCLFSLFNFYDVAFSQLHPLLNVNGTYNFFRGGSKRRVEARESNQKIKR